MSEVQYGGPIKLKPEHKARLQTIRNTNCDVCNGISSLRIADNVQFISEEPLIVVFCTKCGIVHFHMLEALGLAFYKGMIIER